MNVPEDMTADKLREVAKYIDECDSIMFQYLTQAKRQYERGDRGAQPIPEKAFEFVSGKEMQKDLRKWADAIEGEIDETSQVAP